MNKPVLRQWAGWCVSALLAIYISFAMWRANIFETQASDLAVHVRNVHEYKLALRERQLIPLVAPSVNGSSRLALFQYYSGTAYTLPGMMCWAGLDPYLSLKLTIILMSFVGALAIRNLCKLIGLDEFSAFTASVAFQLFPFGGVDLLNRGGYTEWASLQFLPVTMWLSLRTLHARSPAGAWRAVVIASLAWAFFVPIHSVQTLYAGGLSALLVLWYGLGTIRNWRLTLRAVLPYVFGTLLSSWFWLPILLDFSSIQNAGHQGLENVGFTWRTLLAPYFLPSPEIMHGWALQIGLHFFIAAVVVLFYRPSPGRLTWVAAVLFLTCLLILVELYLLRTVQSLLRPMQFSYRLLIPAALLGALCVGQFMGVLRNTMPPRLGFALRGLFLVYVLGSSCVYYMPKNIGVAGKNYHMSVARALSLELINENATQYALYGMDYRRLGWVDGGRFLVNREHKLPSEGVPFEFRVFAESDRDLAGMKFLVDNSRQLLMVSRVTGNRWLIHGLAQPRRGKYRKVQNVYFEAPGGADAIRVSDFMVRPVGDNQQWTRLPVCVNSSRSGHARQYFVDVEPGKAAFYQLPIHSYCDIQVYVNGERAELSSADRVMVIVPLKEGRNVVRVLTMPNPFALALIALVAVAWLVWLAWVTLQRRSEESCRQGKEGNPPAPVPIFPVAA